MIRIGMIIGDRYEIREKIGTGGMSDVYRAHDHKLNRPVAVKVLKAEFSENQNFVEKFHSEAQAAAGLMHPNIVNVYDVGNDKGIHYFVMELVDGITLKKYIEKKSRLSVREAVSIGIQVAMGLDAAHKNGIIHRDIKPQNIMISKEGKVKVTDFGIAKAASSNTITSNVMGSVHYTSPEQARGGFSDAKSDIYSLGVTLFEMVTGRVPYNGDTTVAIAIKHIQEPFPAPKEYAPDLPISVEKIIIKCCQKSPDRRYQSAQELIADLKRSLIEPDSDFVVLVDPDVVGATRIATDGEQETIRHQNTGISRTEQLRLKDEVSQAVEPVPAPTPAPVNTGVYDKPAPGPRPVQRPVSNTRPRRDSEPDHGLDKTMIVMGVVAAVMVVFLLVVFVLSKMAGGGASENPSSAASSGVPVEDNIGIIVPEVVGYSYAEAKSVLTEKGFKVEKISDDESKEPLNIVTGQSVAKGSRLQAGETISLNVSSGKGVTASDVASTEDSKEEEEDDGKIKMPSVIGMDEAAARLTLVENGFDNDKIIIIEVNHDNEGLNGSILNQTPGSGTEVSKDEQITLEMSIGPARTQTYSFSGTIEAPGEDSMYTPGTPVNITITASDGTLLLSTATSSFPYSVSPLSGIASSTGTLEMNFVITTPMTTDPETGVTTGGTTETRSVTRVLNFTPES